MKTLNQLIGRLMFLANSGNYRDFWWPVKEKLCKRYGLNDGYDVQHIEGKRCYSCGGSGKHIHYCGFGSSVLEDCWNCYSGWYKRPAYAVLERFKVGEYVFHQPVKRVLSIDLIDVPHSVIIEGYINHNRQKYSWLAFGLLLFVYDMASYKKWLRHLGVGWKAYWWYPRNWLHTFMHVRRYGWDSTPALKLKRAFRFIRAKEIEELPF